jgi:polyisoprenoid-binding protein YceI
MKRLMSCLTFVAVALLLPLSALLADPVRYTPDKWHTRVYFTVSHMGLSDFGGRFIEHEINFIFDENNFENSSVEVTIPVGSIDTFSPELNNKMGDEGFFDADHYPTMHFISRDIKQIDDSHALMTGDLKIRGVTLPVTFDVTYNGKVMHPFFDLNNVGFSAVAEIDSRAYGVNPLPDWMLASAVKVRIELEAFEGKKVPYYSPDE